MSYCWVSVWYGDCILCSIMVVKICMVVDFNERGEMGLYYICFCLV